jgi:hypothetical protein
MKTVKIRNFRSDHEILIAPMSKEELKENVRKDGTIKVKVYVPFNDLIDNNLEWLNDEVSEKITDSVAGLTDIDYYVAGRNTKNDVIVKVTANVEFDNI